MVERAADREMTEQWCVRVAKAEAEGVRTSLAREGRVDRRLKVRTEGDYVLVPVLEEVPGATRCEFVAYPDRSGLPDHELVGGIALMDEPDRKAASFLLSVRPSVHTVLHPVGDVEGEFRTRRFELLAGTPTTRTMYTEYGLRFAIDLEKAYFSPRLSTERQRLRGIAGAGELVLDMFAGVGPFSIVLADKARLVVSADINPGAVALIVENITLNRVKNVLPVLADAGRLPCYIPWRFDRVVMNLPMAATRFLDQAFLLCRPGGTIHLYVLEEREGQFLEPIQHYGAKKVEERFVRSYSPGKWHAVYDIQP